MKQRNDVHSDIVFQRINIQLHENVVVVKILKDDPKNPPNPPYRIENKT
jgi:hypothetical protein